MPHDLNALIGSRICHDLISPLGAIGNGVELLTMSGAVAVPEVALIAESVDNANARIRFFRVAFGAARTGVDMGRPEIVSILDAVFEGGRLSVDWQVEGDCRRMDVKLTFLLVQCLEAALPWGGAVTVSEDGGVWRMEGRGRAGQDRRRALGHSDRRLDCRRARRVEVPFRACPACGGSRRAGRFDGSGRDGDPDQLLTVPSPVTRYLKLVSCSAPTGPRACILPVAMPISAPIPNSPPSAN